MDLNDDEWEVADGKAEIAADLKELTHECRVCDQAGIALSQGFLGDEHLCEGHYQTWYCRDHLNWLIADSIFCGVIEDAGDEDTVDTDAARFAERMAALGFTDDQIAEFAGNRPPEEGTVK